MSFESDLYKSLLDESRLYREKVSTIWLQKFTTLGAIIVFAATRTEATSKNPGLIATALLSLPFIAVLLDIKLAEFGIHARIIDDFIIRNYHEHHLVGKWERTKWGDVNNPDRWLVRYRSIATLAVSIIPTCIITLLSSLAAEPYLSASAYRILLRAAIAFCLLYLAVGCVSVPLVLFRRTASNHKTSGCRE